MDLSEVTKKEIDRLTGWLMETQSEDGSWRFCCENGPLTDVYMIILLRVLESPDVDNSISVTTAIIGSGLCSPLATFNKSLALRSRGPIIWCPWCSSDSRTKGECNTMADAVQSQSP